ncbi:MAG TPA: hypothetical protein VMZ52_14235 [Bryobacteraceae bacterium]|nr:hypothetical protein [Bryobacteraceae bacterium]
MNWIALTTLGLTLSLGLFAEPGKREEGAEILEKYFSSTEAQKDVLKGFAMDVQIDAKLPKLHKEGKMNALRRISSLGKITYKMLNYLGDDTVKKEVIARYMQAEVQAKADSGSIAITEENYKFKYKGLRQDGERRIHLFELKPKQNRVGLFKGELWLDAATCLPLRETGRLVKNPSIFLKKIEFTRDYEVRDGIAIPKHVESRVDTRLVGSAEIQIDYENVHKAEDGDEAVEEASVKQ